MSLKEKAQTLAEWNKLKDSIRYFMGDDPKVTSETELVRLEDAEVDKREALEKVAWYCPCCNYWHPLKTTCAVFEVWKIREERGHRNEYRL